MTRSNSCWLVVRLHDVHTLRPARRATSLRHTLSPDLLGTVLSTALVVLLPMFPLLAHEHDVQMACLSCSVALRRSSFRAQLFLAHSHVEDRACAWSSLLRTPLHVSSAPLTPHAQHRSSPHVTHTSSLAAISVSVLQRSRISSACLFTLAAYKSNSCSAHQTSPSSWFSYPPHLNPLACGRVLDV